jgi:hypothetical protein
VDRVHLGTYCKTYMVWFFRLGTFFYHLHFVLNFCRVIIDYAHHKVIR